MNNTKRETRGRPAVGARVGAGAMEVKRVTIDRKTADTLRRLGSGNLSAGVRIAAGIIETIKGVK